MPIYEYQCGNKNCGTKIECLQKINDEPIKICPACNTESLRKLVSAAGFRLKGSGWYETDFKGDNDKKKNLSSNETASASAVGKDASAAQKDTAVSAEKSTTSAAIASSSSAVTKSSED